MQPRRRLGSMWTDARRIAELSACNVRRGAQAPSASIADSHCTWWNKAITSCCPTAPPKLQHPRHKPQPHSYTKIVTPTPQSNASQLQLNCKTHTPTASSALQHQWQAHIELVEGDAQIDEASVDHARGTSVPGGGQLRQAVVLDVQHLQVGRYRQVVGDGPCRSTAQCIFVFDLLLAA